MRIIHIDVDTLRADHTTPYGYHRPTTPHLQKPADKSVTFDRCHCSDSPCLPSRTAPTSGQFGIANGAIGHFAPATQFRPDAGHGPEPDRPLLGQRLQTTLQTGPTYDNDPARYPAHLRDTGRAHPAEDLEARQATVNIPVSRHAPDRPRTADLLQRWVQLLQTRDQRPVTTDGPDRPKP